MTGRQEGPESRLSTFRIRAPLLSGGSARQFYASSDCLRFGVVSVSPAYADGSPQGEEELHQHPEEDHVFVVLHGAARFSALDAPDVVLGPWEGIFLPREVVYSFVVEGAEPLVLLRAGGLARPLPTEPPAGGVTPVERLGADGRPLARDLGHIERDQVEAIPGAFFPA